MSSRIRLEHVTLYFSDAPHALLNDIKGNHVMKMLHAEGPNMSKIPFQHACHILSQPLSHTP